MKEENKRRNGERKRELLSRKQYCLGKKSYEVKESKLKGFVVIGYIDNVNN